MMFANTALLIAVISTSLSFHGNPVAAISCFASAGTQVVTLEVPANRSRTFQMADLISQVTPCTSGDQLGVALTRNRPTSSLRIATSISASDADADVELSGSSLTFIPREGFTGSSTGWAIALYARAESSVEMVEACTQLDCLQQRIGVIGVRFEVRNSLPVAIDDSIQIPVAASRIDFNQETGLLHNDLDRNGDPLVVYSAGTTEFHWGWVALEEDGSYRVQITDYALLAPTVVRYVVWDQQGSPTSVDIGYLDIDFTE